MVLISNGGGGILLKSIDRVAPFRDTGVTIQGENFTKQKIFLYFIPWVSKSKSINGSVLSQKIRSESGRKTFVFQGASISNSLPRRKTFVFQGASISNSSPRRKTFVFQGASISNSSPRRKTFVFQGASISNSLPRRKTFVFQGTPIYYSLPSDIRNEKYSIISKSKIKGFCF